MSTYQTTRFTPSREAAVTRLRSFAPQAGKSYAKGRNFDRGEWDQQSVSGLSPYLTRRMLTEQEVVSAVLDLHGVEIAEKYLQEVCWRTYWKGWLEQRPKVWPRYCAELENERRKWADDPSLQKRLQAAESGRTPLTAFNHWINELKTQGYLHNHARMWFAGIWIFELGLPWQLGADFFFRQLLDRDAASNTLSWRWVAGLQTPGKRYLPSAGNIEKYTEGRFDKYETLSLRYQGPEMDALPERELLNFPDDSQDGPVETLLLHRDDLALDLPPSWCQGLKRVILLDLPLSAPGGEISDKIRWFDQEALIDAQARWRSCADCQILSLEAFSQAWRQESLYKNCAMPRAPIGPVRDQLDAFWQSSGHTPRRLLREWDRALWPLATSGFFGFWKKASRRF